MTRRYPFMQVDAFTDRPLGGNPCAVVFETDRLSDETMLAIAREMNLSETAFVRQSSVADFGVRFFTPAEEIPLAGHPTIATTYALVDSGRLSLSGEGQSVTTHTNLILELKVGPIPVEIFSQDGLVERVVMSQKKPQFLALLKPHEVLPAFGLKKDDLLPDAPIQVVSTGTPQLMVPLRSLDVLRRIEMNVPFYTNLRQRVGFFSPHLFVLEGITEAGRTFARHFGVPPDSPEDPFTGSATGGMAAYLWHYGLIERPNFIAEQGHWMSRPGQATVEVIGAPDDILNVKVGGGAVTVLRGELMV
ncbi:MAG: PhzF family phenazine biosynthesis protein [Anaerolineales bacterium]|nr:PhzF family phenazine biosynthesis protein [Anaerolineales bacterium]